MIISEGEQKENKINNAHQRRFKFYSTLIYLVLFQLIVSEWVRMCVSEMTISSNKK